MHKYIFFTYEEQLCFTFILYLSSKNLNYFLKLNLRGSNTQKSLGARVLQCS